MEICRGDIYYADLSPVVGSEQGPTVIIAAITSQLEKAKLPTHIELQKEKYKLMKDSVVLLEQIRTLDKRRLKDKVSSIDEMTMHKVDIAMMISLGITS